MRYFLEIAYNGTNYSGWQIQPNAITVQKVLNDCLSKVLRQPVATIGSGRTDTGVHARQQFVHFDFEEDLDPVLCKYRFNRILPADISVYNLYKMPEGAHARFDAVARTYEYRVTLQKNPFLHEFSLHLYSRPDVQAMNRAAALLLQHQDFSAFCKTNSNTPHALCHIFEAAWADRPDEMLVFTIKANRFLRGMVRLVVGTLLDVGFGKLTVEEFGEVITSLDCRKASSAAPAPGLFLLRVDYPEGFLPAQ